MTKITHPDEQTWLASRTQSIGASEVASILGANPYKSALAVYASKVDGAQQADNSRMRAGRVLERGIAELWAAEKGYELEPKATGFDVWTMPDAPLACTPDAFALAPTGTRHLAEIKNTDPRSPLWSKGPPLYYVVQVQIQIGILRASQEVLDDASLVSFHGGDDVRSPLIQEDPESFGLAVETVRRFWHDHIIPKRPPDPDKWATTDDIRACWKRASEGKRIEVPLAVALRLREAKSMGKVSKQAEELAEAELLRLMGDAEIAVVDGVEAFSWKNQTSHYKEEAAYTIEKRVLRMMKGAEGL